VTDLSNLVEFLRAALDEDERVARAATRGPWRVSVEGSEGSYISPDYGDIRTKSRFIGIANGRVQPEDGRNAVHIARHDPARVLAEVAAKRAIVDRYEVLLAYAARPYDDHPDPSRRAGYLHALVVVMEGLAQPYAGRPGWREEWAT
jgi:hypothetical protein